MQHRYLDRVLLKFFSASRFISGAPKSVKLKLKGGAYVDPDSELQDKAHVLKSGENLYSAVLGNFDDISFYFVT